MGAIQLLYSHKLAIFCPPTLSEYERNIEWPHVVVLKLL